MKVGISFLVFSWLILTALRSGAQTAAAEEGFWRDDLAAARVEAKAAGKPLFVIFRCER